MAVGVGILAFTPTCFRDSTPAGGRKADQEELEWLRELIALTPDEGAGLRKFTPKATVVPRVPPFSYEVYVDLTQSMRPYAAARSGAFHSLAEHLGHVSAQRLKGVYGFGVPKTEENLKKGANPGQPAPEAISVTTLTDPESFSRLSNDFAALLNTFNDASAPTVERIVVTDAVQSDAVDGDRLGPTLTAINQWIDTFNPQGGIFALFLYTSPFKGSYFSESLRTEGASYRLEFDTEARPFVVLAFLTSETALGELERELEDLGEPKTKLVIMPPIPPATARPFEITSPAENALEGMSRQIEYNHKEFGACTEIRLNPKGSADSFTLQFKVLAHPSYHRISNQSQEDVVRMLQLHRAERSLYVKKITHADSPGGAFELVDTTEPTIEPIRPSSPDDPTGAAHTLVTYEFPLEQKSDIRKVWYFMLQPSDYFPPGLPYETKSFIPFSTRNDSSTDPDKQSKILNLDRLVDGICKGRVQPEKWTEKLATSCILITD